MNKRAEPILYAYFREVMDKHADCGIKTISYKKVDWVLSRFMIPKFMRFPITKEMIEHDMLKRIDRYKFEIVWHNSSREKFIRNFLG